MIKTIRFSFLIALLFTKLTACNSNDWVIIHEWSSTYNNADWSTAYAGDFVAQQSPWGNQQMAPGDVFITTLEYHDATNNVRLRTITGPLTGSSTNPGWMMVKGNPHVTLGDHFDIRSPNSPFGEGVWSGNINELLVSAGGQEENEADAAYFKAVQLHVFSWEYKGSNWTGVTIPEQNYLGDIQIRFQTLGFPEADPESDGYIGTYIIGDHEWIVKRFDGYWPNGDHGLLFFNTTQSESIENVDVKAILEFAVEDYNERLNLNKTEVYVRGVQIWKEPLAGYINTTLQDVSIQFNGVTYGMNTPVSTFEKTGGLSGMEIKIYPNPAKDYVYVDMDLQKEGMLSIADLNGKVLLRTGLQNGTNAIDLSGMRKGAYFVMIRIQKGSIVRRLLLY
ncbi:MAG: T9SS C-terminal target domain-containing protein [Bacteroidetes bacterium]|nr:MAG: T9SS C-terminal target domain-containing protein [Bacteroidota bacterium]